MASLNALRALLVGGAVIAALVAAVYGLWLTVAIMGAAVVVHGFLTVRLRRHAGPPVVPAVQPDSYPPATTDPR